MGMDCRRKTCENKLADNAEKEFCSRTCYLQYKAEISAEKMRRIVEMRAQKLSKHAIAERLGVGVRTVEWYDGRIKHSM